MASTAVALVLSLPGKVDTAGGMVSSLAVDSITKVSRTALTNAQIKAMGTTPVQLIAAPPAGKAIIVSQVTARLVCPTGDAFTLGGGADIQIRLTGLAASALVVMGNGEFVGTDATSTTITRPASLTTLSGGADPTAKALTLTTSSAANPAGNAANDNTMTVNVVYTIETYS